MRAGRGRDPQWSEDNIFWVKNQKKKKKELVVRIRRERERERDRPGGLTSKKQRRIGGELFENDGRR